MSHLYLYTGTDQYLIERNIEKLKQKLVNPALSSLNFCVFEANTDLHTLFTEVLTPALGEENKLIVSLNSGVFAKMSPETEILFEHTLRSIPQNNHWLLTHSHPDGRLKSTKTLKKTAQTKQFNIIAPWDTKALLQRVVDAAHFLNVPLTPDCIHFLVHAIGNDTRRLFGELEKLKLIVDSQGTAITHSQASQVVDTTNITVFQLRDAIIAQNQPQFLAIIKQLFELGEPILKVIAVLVTEFRRLLWLKSLMIEEKIQDNQQLAHFLDIPNPGRIYYLKKELVSLSLTQLTSILSVLLQTELAAKEGTSPHQLFILINLLCPQ